MLKPNAPRGRATGGASPMHQLLLEPAEREIGRLMQTGHLHSAGPLPLTAEAQLAVGRIDDALRAQHLSTSLVGGSSLAELQQLRRHATMVHALCKAADAAAGSDKGRGATGGKRSGSEQRKRAKARAAAAAMATRTGTAE